MTAENIHAALTRLILADHEHPQWLKAYRRQRRRSRTGTINWPLSSLLRV